MRRLKKINFICFIVFIFLTSSFVYVTQKMSMSALYEKPWHLLPSVHEDSLSQYYKDHYTIFDKKQMALQYTDSVQKLVLILVDSWGGPVQENLLQEDFASFEEIPHLYALHQRLANRSKHAEMVEYRNVPIPNVYLFGGDSLEYNRKHYLNELNVETMKFCQHCSDSTMLVMLDSLLQVDSLKTIMWTTQSSRTGDRKLLLKSLKGIADLAKQHPNILFIIQGLHRPILGTPETRNMYKSHWVPVVILNRRES